MAQTSGAKNQLKAVNTEKVIGQFNQQELDTLKQTIAKGTTDEQFSLFINMCVSSGLNPFLNHIHCIVYNGKEGPTMSVQIAVEGVQYLARRSEGYRGITAELIHEKDDFTYDAAKREINHKIGFPRGKVIGGYAIAKREGYDDVISLIGTEEVEHMKKGRNSAMWNQWFNDMFKKHIIKRAAKMQYGIEIAEDEQVSAPAEERGSYESGQRREINNVDIIDHSEDDSESEEDLIKEAWSTITGKIEKYGWEKKELTNLIKEKFNMKPNDLSLQQVTALSKFIDFAQQEKEKESQENSEPAADEFDFENEELDID